MVAVKTQFGYPAHRAGEGGIKMAGDEQEAKYKQMIETPVPPAGGGPCGTHHHQHAGDLDLQHGRYLLCRQDRHLGDRRGRGGLFPDGDFSGGGLHHRHRQRQPGLPAAGLPPAGGGRAGRLHRLLHRLRRRRGADGAGPCLHRPDGADAGRDRDDSALRAGLRPVHPARRALHHQLLCPQQPAAVSGQRDVRDGRHHRRPGC